MDDTFTVRTTEQLPQLLKAFHQECGLDQADVALRLGVTQQTVSALERNAEAVSAERLMRLLNILGVEWVLRTRSASPANRQRRATAPTGKRHGQPATQPQGAGAVDERHFVGLGLEAGGDVLQYDSQWVQSPQRRPLSLSLPFTPGNRPHKGNAVRFTLRTCCPTAGTFASG